MQTIDRLIRRDLRGLAPYQPIRPPGSVEGDRVRGPIIKLDGNENVYGCSPRVQRALHDFQAYHVYPDPDQRRLRGALETYTRLDARQIIAGAGSDELIDLLLRLVLEPGDRVVNCSPTFGYYASCAAICGGHVIEAQRTSEYAVDVDGVLAAVDERTKAVFIASPNNPTGTTTPREDVLRLLEAGILVVVDEAYHEFCGKTVADLVPSHENLVVLRTFSKWAGLAGLRVGYGLMSPELVSRLMAVKPPYTPNVAAEVAAIESLRDLDYLQRAIRAIVQERDRLFVLLENLDFLEPVPSEGNFILCRVVGPEARAIQQGLRRKGIFIRHFDTPLLKDFIRISVGKPEHTDAIIRELRAWEDLDYGKGR